MATAEFVLIGGGWRSQFFLRVARELPERFSCVGMMVRDAAKGKTFDAAWGIRTCRTLDELLKGKKPLFAVVSVAKGAAAGVMEELSKRGVACLCETPPGTDVAGLEAVNGMGKHGARIQIAEQYLFQPMHAARLAVAKSGLLGKISQAQVSFTQSYHAMSLIRRYLGVGFDGVKITARKFESPIYQGPDRSGPPREEKIIPCPQTIAILEFGDRVGVFDFANDQHRSYIRSDRILIRGEKGEINDAEVRYLQDFRTPMHFELHRQDAGVDENLEGYFHKGIIGGGKWWYSNPFGAARLFDDEIAVATCMEKMAEYARGGPEFYSLAEASQDTYLGLMVDEAAQEGRTIEVGPRDWGK
jgi:GFO/IDH/MocA oxidoreductase family protein